jgi:hypothetical protein
MPVPTLVSSTPANDEVNVNLNDAISLVWSTSMSPSTMSPVLMTVENTDMDDYIDVTIQYTTGSTSVTITPDRQFEANTTYVVRLLGANDVASPIQSSDFNDLATTASITFQTGTEISAEGLEKTPEQEEVEGDLDLPDNVVVTETSFSVIQTNPENRAWDVPKALEDITVEFSEDVDSGTVNESTFAVRVFPYLEDPLHFAVPVFLGSGEDPNTVPRFEWQDEGDFEDATGGTVEFDPPTGSLVVAGNTVAWVRGLEREFPYNSTVEVTLDRSLADTGGNELAIDQRFTFYVDPWPEWVSPRRIRLALHPVDLAEFPDDVLGLTIWNSTIEVGDMVEWALEDEWLADNLPPRVYKQLVEAKTVADVFRMLLAEKQLAAGEYKRLGDMEHEIRFPTSRAADAKPEQLRKAEEDIAKLIDKIKGYLIKSPRLFIKGGLSVHERPNYRTRLWRTYEKSSTWDTSVVVEAVPAGNTASERNPILPGALDGWA